MQRRSFISNLAVILPAGMVAPKLLLDEKASYKNKISTQVLVLGAGNAALHLAGRLKKSRINVIVAEPSGGTGDAAIFNHTTKAAVIRQQSRHQKANTRELPSPEFGDQKEEVINGFIPTAIEKTENGFLVSDGETAFAAEKIIVALPVQLNHDPGTLKIKITDTQSLQVHRKRSGQKKSVVIKTISVAKIDEEEVVQFAAHKTPGILTIL